MQQAVTAAAGRTETAIAELQGQLAELQSPGAKDALQQQLMVQVREALDAQRTELLAKVRCCR